MEEENRFLRTQLKRSASYAGAFEQQLSHQLQMAKRMEAEREKALSELREQLTKEHHLEVNEDVYLFVVLTVSRQSSFKSKWLKWKNVGKQNVREYARILLLS